MLFQRKIVPYSYASVNEHMQRWSTPGVELFAYHAGKDRKTSFRVRSRKTRENTYEPVAMAGKSETHSVLVDKSLRIF